MTAAEMSSLPSESSVLSEAEAEAEAGSTPQAQAIVQAETWSDEKDEDEDEDASGTEEKEEPTSDTQTRPAHVDREAFPATFDDLCGQMTERAIFLLEVIPISCGPRCHCFASRRPSGYRAFCHFFTQNGPPLDLWTAFLLHPFRRQLAPSTVQSPSATAEGTSALMHHLAEELSDLPTPPPARLQSRLLRWRSEDHGKKRWKGVVDVLRVQSQV